MKKKIIAFLCIMVIMVPYITMFAMPVSAAGENDPSHGITYGADNSLCDRLGFDPGAFFNRMRYAIDHGAVFVLENPHPTNPYQRPGYPIRLQSDFKVADFYGSSLKDHYYMWIQYSSTMPDPIANVDFVRYSDYDHMNAHHPYGSTGYYNNFRSNKFEWEYIGGRWEWRHKDYWKIRYPHENEYWEYVYNTIALNLEYVHPNTYNVPDLMTYLTWLEKYYPGYYVQEKITIKDRSEMSWWDNALNKLTELKTAVQNSPAGQVFSFLTGSAQSFFDSASSKLNSIFTAIQNSPVGNLFTWLNTTLWNTIDSISTAAINFPTTLNNLWTDIKNIGSTISTAIFSPLWDFIFPSKETVGAHIATRMNEFKSAENSILIIPIRFFGDLINFTEEIQADNGFDVGGGVSGGGFGGGGGGVWGGEGAPENPGQYVITVPSVSIPIKGTTHQLWSGFSFDLATIDTYYGFAWLNNFCRILISGALIFGLIYHIYRKTYSALAGGLVE